MGAATTPASSTVRVRPCTNGDAAALSLVGQATFLETFAGTLDGGDIVAHCALHHAPSHYAALLARPAAAAWLAEAAPGGAPVGYAVLDTAALPVPDPRPDDVELKRIYVLGRWHGTGTGRALLAHVVDAARASGARRLLLGVYAGNARARAFYTREGFAPVAERRFQVGARAYEDVVFARGL